MLVGPTCLYNDYIDFITGKNILKHQKKVLTQNGNGHCHLNGNGHSNGNGYSNGNLKTKPKIVQPSNIVRLNQNI